MLTPTATQFAGRTNVEQDWASMLATAIQEARSGLAEGGLPIGAAMFNMQGELLSSGHNRRVQHSDPSAHAETDAFRRAGRLRSYREVVMVTTLAPCWYCSGLVRQFGIRTLVVGESRTFSGGLEWLRSAGVKVFDLDSEECVTMMQSYIRDHAVIWHEDIGEG
jgi:cytosine deaminase